MAKATGCCKQGAYSLSGQPTGEGEIWDLSRGESILGGSRVRLSAGAVQTKDNITVNARQDDTNARPIGTSQSETSAGLIQHPSAFGHLEYRAGVAKANFTLVVQKSIHNQRRNRARIPPRAWCPGRPTAKVQIDRTLRCEAGNPTGLLFIAQAQRQHFAALLLFSSSGHCLLGVVWASS